MSQFSKKAPKSYHLIMDTAKSLFWKFGFKRITIEEICREAGVSKMTFYRHFNNKNTLAEQVLVREMEKGVLEYDKIMVLPISFSEKIARFVQLKHESSKDLGEEFIKDIHRTDNVTLLSHIEENRNKMLSKLRTDLEKAQKQGAIRQGLKIDFVIYLLQNLNEKMADDRLRSMYDNPHDLIMELTRFFFYGLLTDRP